MAQPLPTLTNQQITDWVDTLAPGDEVRITWSSTVQRHPVTWVGSVLTADHTSHKAKIAYPDLGTFEFPPVHQAVMHVLTKQTFADPWAHAQENLGKKVGVATVAVDPQEISTWGMFIEQPSVREKDLVFFQFSQWIRGRHGMPSDNRTQTGNFVHHRRNDLICAMEAWVRVAQQDPDWRNPLKLKLGDQILVGLESYILADRGGDFRTFAAELDQGKSVKAAATKAMQKKGSGGAGGQQ